MHRLLFLINLIFPTLILLSLNLSYGQKIQIPIEMIGEAGMVKTVKFEIADETDVDILFLKIHRPVYRDISVNPARGEKVSFRLNDGTWTGISNATATAAPQEKKYGGLNGAYHTVRMYIPIANIRKGENILSFRYNGTDGFTSGYRVLEMNVLRNNTKVLPSDSFQNDDPKNWTPPLSGQADIDEGKDLWENAILHESPLNKVPLRAKCASCHAADGRDLKYFGYSNLSIEERSKFHGLSQKEASQIASYIRSLDIEMPDKGRPWNPPYQPGPGLDSKPVHEWSAGAGLEAVLEDDAQSTDQIFGGNLGINNIRSIANVRGTVNVREIPIAMQLPDWNAWLPDVHPLDAIGDKFLDVEVFREKSTYDSYKTVLEQLEQDGVEALIANGSLRNGLYTLAENTTNANNISIERLNLKSDTNGDQNQYRHILHWGSIKTWELMQRFGLDDKAPEIYGEFGEKRSWISQRRNVFELAPHRLAGNKSFFAWQDVSVGKYFSTAWYQLQLTLNSGNRNASNLWPVDWNYQPNHILGLHTTGLGPKHPYRYLISHIKMLQQYYDDKNIEERTAMGVRQINPARYAPYANGGHSQLFSELISETRSNFFEVLLEMTMDNLERHPIESWNRDVDPVGKAYTFLPKDHMPKLISERDWGLAVHEGNYADTWFTMIPYFRESGVSEEVLNRMIDWANKMWPKGDWKSLRIPETNRLPIASILIESDMVYVGDTVVFDASGSLDPDGNITSYYWSFGDAVFADGIKTSHIYGEPGTFEISLKVTDDKKSVNVVKSSITVLPKPQGEMSSFTIYPIPSRNGEPINIRSIHDEFSVSMYSLDGSLITTKETRTGLIELSVALPSSGMYIIRTTFTDKEAMRQDTEDYKIIME